MERINPDSLSGPRAFFTAFDHRIVDQSIDIDVLRRDCERKLKLLLLLKSHVVCSATHLKSKIAWEIFSQNPFLLEERHVIPALQEVKPRVSEAFNAPPSVKAFYEDHVTAVVDWEVVSNSSWFRDRFIEALRNPHSMLRRQAPNISETMAEHFIDEHATRNVLGRTTIQQWANPLPTEQLRVVLAFRELLYHFSGARVVNCEGSLPQEEYVDFDIADLSQQRTRLSEDVIFMKLFVELVRDELCQRPVPLEVLDLLSFQDIAAIRVPYADSGFQARYDELTRTAIDLVRGEGQGLVHDIDRLDSIRANLSAVFRAVIDEEVNRFAVRRKVGVLGLASAGTSVALGLASLVPGLGAAAALAALGKDGSSLLFNLSRFTRQPRLLHQQLVAKDAAIRSLAERRFPGDAVLIDAVDLLLNTLSQRLTL